jgi:ABC-type antimicrobial peptide transport system permease subunit
MDPAVPFYSVRTMSQQVANSEAVFARRYPLLGLRLFSGAALGLALIGLFGLMSFNVRQRRREFGIRAALGAGRAQIAMPVLAHAAGLAAVGFAGGVMGSVALSGVLRSLLYGVSAADPATFIRVALVLSATVAAGAWLPVRYAVRVPPSDVLRTE